MKKMMLYSGFFALLMGWSTYSGAQQIDDASEEFFEGCQEIECTYTAIPSKFSNHNEEEIEAISMTRSSKSYGSCANKSHREKSTPTLSLNWSGYATLTDRQDPKNYSVSQVAGSWIVPTAHATSVDSYSASWVGIDGFFTTSDTVEQIGTSQNWVDGQAEYFAWFEMYPQGSYLINDFPVHPGDKISAQVKFSEKEENLFILTIANKTRKVYAKVPKSYTVQPLAVRTSAEWIMEAPSSSTTEAILPLADYKTIHFFDCEATINGKKGSINRKHWENAAITMVTDILPAVIVSKPSKLHSQGFSFDVTRLNADQLGVE